MKPRRQSKNSTSHIVHRSAGEPLTQHDLDLVEKLLQNKNRTIDFSDAPEVTVNTFANRSGILATGLFRPYKQQLTLRIDSDIIAWAKRDGTGYQSRINAALRKAMMEDVKPNKKKPDAMGRAFIILLLLAIPCLAQDPSPYTLHVYQDLIQIPVLVLDRHQTARTGLKTRDFSIRLDSGPAFHPLNTHIEADDPLGVIVLLDASNTTLKDFLTTTQSHLPELPSTLFRPQDRLSVFAFDCNFIASAQNQPASNALLQQTIASVTSSPALHAPPHRPCPRSIFLWDAINAAVSLSNAMPGRRVLFVLSSGQDSSIHGLHSTHSWNEVARSAATLGFTLFGLRDRFPQAIAGAPEDPFSLLCAGTGGLALFVNPQLIHRSLPDLFTLIRSRYILEFPRPAKGVAGFHHIDVAASDPSLLVLTGGDSAPILDPSTLPDPTLTPGAAPRPTFGTRKPLDPK